jgi:hypothetical protein
MNTQTKTTPAVAKQTGATSPLVNAQANPTTCSTCGGKLEALHSLTSCYPGEYADAYDYVCPTCD